MNGPMFCKMSAMMCYQISDFIYQTYPTCQTDEASASWPFSCTLLLSTMAIALLYFYNYFLHRPHCRSWLFFDIIVCLTISLAVAIHLFLEIISCSRTYTATNADWLRQPFVYQLLTIAGSFLLFLSARLTQIDHAIILHRPAAARRPLVRIRQEQRNREAWLRLARQRRA